MDVKELLSSDHMVNNSVLSLTGWIVDTEDGLFLLGDHFPEDYDYQFRIKIINQNIIYSILKTVPSLAGGFSILFYRSRILAKFIDKNSGIIVKKLSVEIIRESGRFDDVDVSEETVSTFVSRAGDYKFGPPRSPTRDWLDDV